MLGIIKGLVEEAVENGGATHWLTYERTKGYIVGMNGVSFELPEHATPGELAIALLALLDVVKPAHADTLGAWVDGNKLYLDWGIYTDAPVRANELALHYKQLAYWNIHKNSEVCTWQPS